MLPEEDKKEIVDTGKRMKLQRKSKGISADEVAEELGVSRSTIFRYENGDIEKVPAASLKKIAEILETTPSYLMGWTDDPRDYENDPDIQIPSEALKMGITPEQWAAFQNAEAEDAQRNRNLPSNIRPAGKRRYRYLGKVACGEPIFADEQKETYVDLDSDVRADFVLEAKGDSMINARIYDGDIVFIREQPDVQDGELAVVIIDDEATLKRVYKYDDHISLFSENPKYKPIIVKANEGKTVRIIGKAIGAYITLN